MQHKRQFQTAARRRTFFDRKVHKYGYGRQLSLGKVIPKDWQYVRIRVVEQTSKHITLSLDLLWTDTNDTRNTKANQTGRPDT